MLTSKKRTLLSDLGLFYCAVVWGSTFYIIKDALDTLHPVALVAYRFGLAALLLLPFLILTRKRILDHWKEGFYLGLLLYLIYVPQTIGLGSTSAANSGFITGLFVLFVPLFGYLFFKRSPSRRQALAALVALVGLWVLTGGLQEVKMGDLITLITAMTYGMHLLVADRFMKREIDPYVLAFQQLFVLGFLSFLTCFALGFPTAVSASFPFGPILFLAIFPTVLALLIQLKAQKNTSPVKVSLIFALEPVFAALFAWTLGGEHAQALQLVGGGLIVLAMMVSDG